MARMRIYEDGESAVSSALDGFVVDTKELFAGLE
jgi:hypothetical protein